MNKKLLIITVFICALSFAQKSKSEHNSKKKYIPLKNYKKLFTKKLTSKDTLNFKYFDGDTLVLVKNSKKFNKANMYNNSKPRAYMPLKDYKRIYKREITQDDIAKFKFDKGDTLILISNKDFYKKTVSVPYEPKDSTFLEIYKDVVYKKYSSQDTSSKKKIYMKLWKSPVKIYFSESLDNFYKQKIVSVAKKLSKEIDSLNISFVTNLEESNYIIYQIDDEHKYRYEKRLSKNEYLDYTLYWNKNIIYDAKLELNLIKYKYLSKKIHANYLMQSFVKTLGHFDSTYKLKSPSIFSTRNRNNKELTKEDIEILKYHYSYGICKFTDLATFEANHENAKNVFEKTGRQLNFSHQY